MTVNGSYQSVVPLLPWPIIPVIIPTNNRVMGNGMLLRRKQDNVYIAVLYFYKINKRTVAC